MLRIATSLMSPAGARGKLSSFIFHRVLPEPDSLLPDVPYAAQFEQMLDWIGGQFQVLAPQEACERLVSGSLPARAAIITFDDGYRDNLEVATPILERRGMQAAFFIATGYLDGGVMFNDRVIEAVRAAAADTVHFSRLGLGVLPLSGPTARRTAIDAVLTAIKHLPFQERLDAVAYVEDSLSAGALTSPMMSSLQVARLQNLGMTLGGHTRSHPILAVLAAAEAQAEIDNGRDDLHAITGIAPTLFAYPNGRKGRDYLDAHAEMVRGAGFSFAFTTEFGAAERTSPRFELPRFTPWSRSRLPFQARAWGNLLNQGKAA